MTDEQALKVLQAGLIRARQLHPDFADGNLHGLAVVMTELWELQSAIVCQDGIHRERAEALDVAITAMRFYLGEYGPKEVA